MSKTLSIADAKAANIQVVSSEEGTKGNQAVHDLVTAYRANRRSGTANTKTRGEVAGTGKKMYRQKGTGGARHGDKKAPIFVGGGVAFGPKPRSYAKHVTKSTRKLAFRKALGSIIEAGKVISVSEFKIADGKTKSFLKHVAELTESKKVVIVGGEFDDPTCLSQRNVREKFVMTADEVNVEQLLHADTVILVEDAVETIAKRTA